MKSQQTPLLLHECPTNAAVIITATTATTLTTRILLFANAWREHPTTISLFFVILFFYPKTTLFFLNQSISIPS
jgi:hypothetical protein